jgi:predicted RNA binding protein YcfA (HicA-like mRNA interferase family)
LPRRNPRCLGRGQEALGGPGWAAGPGGLTAAGDSFDYPLIVGSRRCREIVKRLKESGFEFDRQAAGSRKIWYNPKKTNRYTTVPNYPGVRPKEKI